MTIFLCILALLALWNMPTRVKAPATWVIAVYHTGNVLLVLGLATLALVAHLW